MTELWGPPTLKGQGYKGEQAKDIISLVPWKTNEENILRINELYTVSKGLGILNEIGSEN